MITQGLMFSQKAGFNFPAQAIQPVPVYDMSYNTADTFAFMNSTDNASFNNTLPGTSDFCIELWAIPNRFISNIMSSTGDAGSSAFSFYISNDGVGNFYLSANVPADGGGVAIIGSPLYYVPITSNTWYHFAMVRYNGDITLYVNGVPQTIDTRTFAASFDSTNIIGGQWNFFGGPLGDHDQTNPYAWSGPVRNFRYVIGQPVYTSQFTPPNNATDLTSIAGTQLLFLPTVGEITTSGGAIIDDSGNGYIIQTYGTSPAVYYPYPAGGQMGTWRDSTTTGTPQTWTASGTPNVPTTSSTPIPVIGTTCGNFNKTGTGVRIVSTGTQTFSSPGTYWTVLGWIYIPAATDGTIIRDLITTEVTNGFGLRLGKDSSGTDINYLGIFAKDTADLTWFQVQWARNSWNFFVVQSDAGTVGAWAGVNGALFGTPLTGGSGTGGSAANYAFAAMDSNGMSIGARAGSTVSPGYYLNEIYLYNTTFFGYPGPGTPIQMPYINPPNLYYNSSQLLIFQGTNGGTTFTNQTS